MHNYVPQGRTFYSPRKVTLILRFLCAYLHSHLRTATIMSCSHIKATALAAPPHCAPPQGPMGCGSTLRSAPLRSSPTTGPRRRRTSAASTAPSTRRWLQMTTAPLRAPAKRNCWNPFLTPMTRENARQGGGINQPWLCDLWLCVAGSVFLAAEGRCDRGSPKGPHRQ